MLSDQEKGAPCVEPEKTMPVPEKASQSPDTSVLALKSGQEVSTPSIIREKVSQDGYSWRKYGQKLVKGNEYVRSYYRCTYPNCQVKKQLECSHNGQIVDIVCFGQHDHPKTQLNVPVAGQHVHPKAQLNVPVAVQHSHPKAQLNVPVAVGFIASTAEERHKEPSLTSAKEVSVDEPSLPPTKAERVDTPPHANISADDSPKVTPSQSNYIKEVKSDDDPALKRQKKDKHDHKTFTVNKPTSELRLVVQTQSEVDIVNDGHRWRKYGQKIVKGSPHPRSYYRCSNSGCPVKKHVERATHDPKVVITTYEGEHNHDRPPTRIVTHNVPGSSTSPTAHEGDVGTKSDVHAISEHESKSQERVNSELGTKSAVNKTTGLDIESCPKPNSKSDKKQNGRETTLSKGQRPDSEPVQS